MASAEYHKAYRKEYWKTKKQVSVVLTKAQYRDIEARAKASGRTVGQQMFTECQAYQAGDFVPNQEITSRLDEIIRVLRGIGNNINQMAHHSNAFKKLIGEQQVFEQLRQLETEAVDLVRSAWRRSE